jgi:hypothetical protein
MTQQVFLELLKRDLEICKRNINAQGFVVALDSICVVTAHYDKFGDVVIDRNIEDVKTLNVEDANRLCNEHFISRFKGQPIAVTPTIISATIFYKNRCISLENIIQRIENNF